MLVETIRDGFMSLLPGVAAPIATESVAKINAEKRTTGVGEIIRRKPPKTLQAPNHPAFEENREYHSPAPFVLSIAGGRVHGQGVVITPDNKVVGEVSRELHFNDSASHSLCERPRLNSPWRTKLRVGVAATAGSGAYFHWLFDCLPRVEALKSLPVDRIYVSQRKRFQRDFLRLLGIDACNIISARKRAHIQAETLVVPSLRGDIGNVPRSTCEFIQSLGRRVTRPERSFKKIWVSRNDARWRKVRNEPLVTKMLRSRGYKVVELTGASVVDQIQLFANAESIVGPHGAGLSNIVFARNNTTVVELFSPRYVNVCYWALANQCGQNYGYLIGENGEHNRDDDPRVFRDDMTVNVDALAALLDEM